MLFFSKSTLSSESPNDRKGSSTKKKQKKKKGQEEAKPQNTKYIAPLSPVYPDDANPDGYNIYSDYLNQAFKDPNIKNIAVTGNYGIGKSSFIKKWSNNKKYLFISLCNFSDKNRINLECDLLQQILLGCGYVAKKEGYVERDLSNKAKFFTVFSSVIIAVTTYFLTFYSVLRTAFLSIFSNLDISTLVHWIKFITYGVFSLLMVVGLPWLIFKFVSHYKLTKISIKLQHAEIEAERESNVRSSYFDRYRLNLVYVLRYAAEKLDYTIVFEDLDRLAPEDCCALLTELRELNRLVNMDDSEKTPKKIMRFIYVMNDAVFHDKYYKESPFLIQKSEQFENIDQLLNLKFFDYILPIVPTMIANSSATQIVEYFEKVGFCKDEHLTFIDEISKYLSDYRLIKNITNEYAVLKDVYEKNNPALNVEQQRQLMALVIYKVLMPVDYKQIRENKSLIFPMDYDKIREGARSEHKFTSSIIKKSIAHQAVDYLLTSGELSYQCLIFIGYDKKELKKYFEIFFDPQFEVGSQERQKVLKENFALCAEIISDKLENQVDMSRCLSSVCYTMLEGTLRMKFKYGNNTYFSDLLEKIKEFDINNLENCTEKLKESLTDLFERIPVNQLESNEFLIFGNYLKKINHLNYEWFFFKTKTLDIWRFNLISSFKLEDRLIKFKNRHQSELVAFFNSFPLKTIEENLQNRMKRDHAQILSQMPGLREDIQKLFHFNLIQCDIT